MAKSKDLWTLSITTVPALVEALTVQLEDQALAISTFTPPRTDKAVIEALFDAPPDIASLTAQMAVIAALHGCKPPKINSKPVPQLDWLKKVAADFPPIRLARWTVHGAEHRHSVPNRRFALQIDATSAFGTGEHPTTRGCLIMLDSLLKSRSTLRRNLLDVGCGSGILAMAYAQAAHGKALAVDLDNDAVKIAKDNIRTNGLQSFITTGKSFGYRYRLVREKRPYDLIMANIFARPLCAMAKDLKNNLRPGGMAILSGLLNEQANMVISAHVQQGLRLVKHLKLKGWSVLALRRPIKA